MKESEKWQIGNNFINRQKKKNRQIDAEANCQKENCQIGKLSNGKRQKLGKETNSQIVK